MHKVYNVEVTYKNLSGIHVYEFAPVNPDRDRLVIFQHGFTMNKEDGSWNQCMHYASRGIKAVAIDAYGHGERKTKQLQYDDYLTEMKYFYEIIVNTAHDIKNLYETHYKDQYPVFNIAGESMGGMLTFMVGCITPNLKAIASVVGSPSLVFYGYEDMAYHNCDDKQYAGMLDNLEVYDAMSHLEKFLDVKMYFINGTRDMVVPKKYAIEFKRIMEETYQKNDIVYKEVDCDHWVPHEHLISMYDWAIEHFE